MDKKYNNNSRHVSDWTTQKLKKMARSLHNLIKNEDSFSANDVMEYEVYVDELEGRGYTVKETHTLLISK